MLSFTAEDTGIVRIAASGRLTKDDYERFLPEFERIAGARGPVRVLIELDDFHGWDMGGLWEELKFDVAHQGDLGRVAVVGEKAWQEWGTRLSKPFFRAAVRYFEKGGAGAARAWLAEP